MSRLVRGKYKNYIDYNCDKLTDDLKELLIKYPSSDMKDAFVRISYYAYRCGMSDPRVEQSGDALILYNDIKEIPREIHLPKFAKKYFYAILKK